MRAAIVRSGGPREAHHCETHEQITGFGSRGGATRKRDRHDGEKRQTRCRKHMSSKRRVALSRSCGCIWGNASFPAEPGGLASKRGAAHEAEKPLTKHTHETHTRNTHTKHTHDTRKRPLVQPRARERSSRFCFSAKVTSDHTHSEAAITRAAETRACVWR